MIHCCHGRRRGLEFNSSRAHHVLLLWLPLPPRNIRFTKQTKCIERLLCPSRAGSVWFFGVYAPRCCTVCFHLAVTCWWFPLGSAPLPCLTKWACKCTFAVELTLVLAGDGQVQLSLAPVNTPIQCPGLMSALLNNNGSHRATLTATGCPHYPPLPWSGFCSHTPRRSAHLESRYLVITRPPWYQLSYFEGVINSLNYRFTGSYLIVVVLMPIVVVSLNFYLCLKIRNCTFYPINSSQENLPPLLRASFRMASKFSTRHLLPCALLRLCRNEEG